MGSTLVTPLWGLFQYRFGFSEITLTLIYATYVVGNLVALLFFGRISDRLGRRKVALPALLIAILGALSFLFARSDAWLYAGRLLIGVAVGLASGTGTAWLAELYGATRQGPATVSATVGNQVGIAVGPLIAGILAQYAPYPLQLPFVAYIAVLVAAAAVIMAWPPETVASPVALAAASLRPRIGVPPSIRWQFVAPMLTAFAIFSLTGFYYALLPNVLREALGNGNVAITGAIVFEMIGTTIAVLLIGRNLPSRVAMFSALLLILPSAALLVLTQSLHSMAILLCAGLFTGASLALGYRGSLQVVNEIAPHDRRAEVVSSYLLACFAGNAIPVIGVALVAARTTLLTASLAFSCALAVLSLLALGAHRRYGMTSAAVTNRPACANRS